jgi:PAS domain S-box-containing protein
VDKHDETKKREAELRRMLASVRDHVWSAVADEDGGLKHTYSSPAIARITGRPAELFVNTTEHWLEVVLPEDRERVQQSAVKVMSGRAANMEMEYRIVLPNGEVRWVNDKVAAERIGGGRVQLDGIVSDITERRKLEEELRQLSRAVEQSPAIVMITDTDGAIEYVNPAFTAITGYEPEEAMGRNPRMLASGLTPRATYDDLWATITAGETWRGELCNMKKNGELYWESVSISPVTDPDGTTAHYTAVKDDITEQKRARQIEEALSGERLRTAKLESIAILAGGIAHDFNNYLTGIIGNISLAQLMQKKGSTERVGELLESTRKACEQTANLTQKLLTFSKGGAPVTKTLELSAMLRDECQFCLSGSSTRCEFAIDKDLWHVEADEGQMSQVIHNIALNADQAMSGGGLLEMRAENVVVGLRTSVPLPPGRYVRLTFRDQGVGIPEEQLSRVFDPYFTTKPDGSGLGLATTYSIVKRHGGHMAVESEVGEGTEFYVYLPTSVSDRARAVVSVTPQAGDEAVADGPVRGRILVMDDESTVLRFIVAALTACGHEVTSADDGSEAVALYEKARADGIPFDVVILDLTVPGGDGGRATLEAIRAADPKVKAIAASGYSEDPIIANPTAFGFAGALAKPLTVEDLANAVSGVLRN